MRNQTLMQNSCTRNLFKGSAFIFEKRKKQQFLVVNHFGEKNFGYINLISVIWFSDWSANRSGSDSFYIFSSLSSALQYHLKKLLSNIGEIWHQSTNAALRVTICFTCTRKSTVFISNRFRKLVLMFVSWENYLSAPALEWGNAHKFNIKVYSSKNLGVPSGFFPSNKSFNN